MLNKVEILVRDQITRRLEQAVDSWNQGDLDGYMSLYLQSEFTSLVTDEDIVHGYRSIRSRYEKAIGKSGRLSFHIVETLYMGGEGSIEYAYAVGQFTVANGNLADKHGNFSLLMMRQGGQGWLVFKDHSA